MSHRIWCSYDVMRSGVDVHVHGKAMSLSNRECLELIADLSRHLILCDEQLESARRDELTKKFRELGGL